MVGSKATPKGHACWVQAKEVVKGGRNGAVCDGETGISWGVVKDRVDVVEVLEAVKNRIQGEEPETAQSMAGSRG